MSGNKEKFFRIFKRTAASGAVSWQVTDRTGTQFDFGTSTDSVQRSGSPIRWFLKKITDTNGNFIQFTYQADGGDFYPDYVEYTGNLNGAQRNLRVDFSFEDRHDSATTFDFGIPITTKKRLKKIETKAGS